MWSPRERGWTLWELVRLPRLCVVPARAGVDPPRYAAVFQDFCGPRASGGGPPDLSYWADRIEWSPRERGWTSYASIGSGRREVVPARAGVDPDWPHGAVPRTSGPRASGGGPRKRARLRQEKQWSPRERGWTSPAARRG